MSYRKESCRKKQGYTIKGDKKSIMRSMRSMRSNNNKQETRMEKEETTITEEANSRR